ncbi:Uma2 family endonuclease [Gloeobacter morelensis]|uniref:Uma2 family endonuclease n=1 Tax=Gloeobacter morelensis TaxID=2907343 RepID=UPI001E38CCC1|nr:Uma2 family endonuclease [Gloeobacter morelensis]
MVSVPKGMSPAQYLEWESYQQIRHEYVHGEIFGMTGGSIAHNTVAVNVARLLGNHLETSGSPCRVFISDVKAQITEDGPFYYPDVMVTCDERDRSAIYTLRHPCLIVEVLSPTTEAFDRGNKFADYRRIDALQEYVLFDSRKIAVEHYRRESERTWKLMLYTAEDSVHLESVRMDWTPFNAKLYYCKRCCSFGSWGMELLASSTRHKHHHRHLFARIDGSSDYMHRHSQAPALTVSDGSRNYSATRETCSNCARVETTAAAN